MIRASRLIAAVLVGLIVLTAQSAAVARSMPDASGQMVICTGTGPVMVYVDRDGNPTRAPHICPDYALSLIVALDAGLPDSLASVGVWDRADWTADALVVAVRKHAAATARGPPAVV